MKPKSGSDAWFKKMLHDFCRDQWEREEKAKKLIKEVGELLTSLKQPTQSVNDMTAEEQKEFNDWIDSVEPNPNEQELPEDFRY